MNGPAEAARPGRLSGALFTECAEWIWEQLQEEDGIFLSGELVELILVTERELGIHDRDLFTIASTLAAEFAARGIQTAPGAITADLIRAVLEWEDQFLGLAGIPRAES
ncbi:hypothetical protein HRbin29_00793 [bacterium HR29]|jgi:hypothetical protein|nr:hypothetical protein HRbin29_00793 [bacterium HR29]